MCDFFQVIKNIFLLCKYLEVISVTSSVQVTLQLYFQIFYSTVPNKLKKTNC